MYISCKRKCMCVYVLASYSTDPVSIWRIFCNRHNCCFKLLEEGQMTQIKAITQALITNSNQYLQSDKTLIFLKISSLASNQNLRFLIYMNLIMQNTPHFKIRCYLILIYNCDKYICMYVCIQTTMLICIGYKLLFEF